MQLIKPNTRLPTTTLRRRGSVPKLLFVVLAFFVFNAPARTQQPATSNAKFEAPLTSAQVVQNLVQMNQHRAAALHSYEGTRIYRVEYHGFPGNRNADMVVSVKYCSPTSKEFVVQSANGSGLIVDKVFKKLLEAEKEALSEESQQRSALTSENYLFEIVAYESGVPNPLYVLQVEPRRKDKFLYRGRIWVDAEDFAVVRMEVAPAKNPSFWTKDAEIEQVYQKVGGFWVPASNKSVTTIRLGGRAELTILYRDYKITSGSQVPPLGDREARIFNDLSLGKEP